MNVLAFAPPIAATLSPAQEKTLDAFVLNGPHSHGELVPAAELPAVREACRAALAPPASQKETAGALGFLFAPYPKADFQNQAVAVEVYAAIIKEHAGASLRPAINQLHREKTFLPRPAELKAALVQAEAPLRARLYAAERMHRQHQKREEERQADEARKAKNRAMIERLEAGMRERLGDAAPAPGEYADAWALLLYVARYPRTANWQTAIASAEPWAASLCRQLAAMHRKDNPHRCAPDSPTRTAAERLIEEAFQAVEKDASQ
jgi:hypothetical protein